jgi:hypothetical protein
MLRETSGDSVHYKQFCTYTYLGSIEEFYIIPNSVSGSRKGSKETVEQQKYGEKGKMFLIKKKDILLIKEAMSPTPSD